MTSSAWTVCFLNDNRPSLVERFPLEKVTNIAMGTEIDAIQEFEVIECRHPGGREGLIAAGLME